VVRCPWCMSAPCCFEEVDNLLAQEDNFPVRCSFVPCWKSLVVDWGYLWCSSGLGETTFAGCCSCFVGFGNFGHQRAGRLSRTLLRWVRLRGLIAIESLVQLIVSV
jgi:hypothetical protein